MEEAPPEVARQLAALVDQVAVVVHHAHADEGDGAHDVGADEAGRDPSSETVATVTGGARSGVVGASAVMSRVQIRTRGGAGTIARSRFLPDQLVDRRPSSAGAARRRRRRSPGTARRVRDEHHRRVHVRPFEQGEPAALEVERAASVVERGDAVRVPAPMTTSVPSAITRRAVVAGDGAGGDGVHVEDVGAEVQRRLVAVPQRRAEPNREAPARPAAAEPGEGVGSEVADPQRRRPSAGGPGRRARPASARPRRRDRRRRRRAAGGCCSRSTVSPAARDLRSKSSSSRGATPNRRIDDASLTSTSPRQPSRAATWARSPTVTIGAAVSAAAQRRASSPGTGRCEHDGPQPRRQPGELVDGPDGDRRRPVGPAASVATRSSATRARTLRPKP